MLKSGFSAHKMSYLLIPIELSKWTYQTLGMDGEDPVLNEKRHEWVKTHQKDAQK